MSQSIKSQRIAPLLNGDETRYKRRYRALKELVNELSDESNLLALRVHKIQRRLYDQHMATYGTPPPPVPVPEEASWAPLVLNKATYPPDVGAPPAPPAPASSVPATGSAPPSRAASPLAGTSVAASCTAPPSREPSNVRSLKREREQDVDDEIELAMSHDEEPERRRRDDERRYRDDEDAHDRDPRDYPDYDPRRPRDEDMMDDY